MSAVGRPPRIEIPRWVQLVGLPLLLVLAWVVATAAAHVVFLFLVAGADRAAARPARPRAPAGPPAPRPLGRARVPELRGGARAGHPGGRDRGRRSDEDGGQQVQRLLHESSRRRRTDLGRPRRRPAAALAEHAPPEVASKIQKRGHKLVRQIRQRDVGKYTNRIVTFVEGAAISIGKTLFSVVLLVVVSIYMLLDMQRLGRTVDRRFPPRPGEQPLPAEHRARTRVVRARAGGALADHRRERRHRPVGARCTRPAPARPAVRAALRRVGRGDRGDPVPRPVARRDARRSIYALVVHPISALWVALLFLGIHQIEGHVVVPKVMGNALRLHPLLVIFGLAAGAELYGLAGRADRAAAARRRPRDLGVLRRPHHVRAVVRASPCRSRSSWSRSTRRVRLGRELVPRHPAAPAAPHRRAARPRARDLALARRPRACRSSSRPRRCRTSGCRRSRATRSTRSLRECRGARAPRRAGGDPLRHARGEGRRGLGRVDRGRHRAAGAARAAPALPGAAAADRRLSLRVHVARPLRRHRTTARSTTTRRSS